MSRLLVRGGRLIGAGLDVQADLLVEDGTVRALGHDLGPAETEMDASGCYVLPGGVDPHVHLEFPGQGTVTADNIASGTLAAAHGGTTTVINFVMPGPGEGLDEAVARSRKSAQGNAMVDYGCHVVLTGLGPGTFAQLDALVAAGVPSVKLFMAYPGELMVDDGVLFSVMEHCAAIGMLPMVHAENGTVIDLLVRRALAAGHTSAGWHGRTRPVELEAEAVHRASVLAGLAGAPVYFVHVSCKEAVGEVAAARRAGRPVYAETCPHYLFLDSSVYDEPDFGPARYVMTPPLRPAEHQGHLWQALRDGDLCSVATDHCPFCLVGQKDLGRDDFSRIPNGAPGIEHRLALLHGRGVTEGHMSLAQLVSVTSTAPAKLFGLYPRKGSLQPGADADIVVLDPTSVTTISAATSHMRVDHSIYEGWRCQGAVRTVLVRGVPVVLDGESVDGPGTGQFVPRAAFS